MSTFEAYADFYDLFYRDKDYAREAAYVGALLGPRPTKASLLELGCGTGGHAVHFASAFEEVHGVDLSPRMLERAERRKPALAPRTGRLSFSPGDIRAVRLEGRYDAVVSLFHVVSYQLTDTDLEGTFATAAHHLAPGGTFIFDFWYGPGVLRDPPVVRVRRFEDQGVEVLRIAEPTLCSEENRVDVDYTLVIRESGACREVRERHSMRYLFLPELRSMLTRAGLRVEATHDWLTHERPSPTSWSACIVARR